MRELLQRWAAIEPGRCKRESEFNQIQPKEREQVSILTPYGWQIVFTEAGYHPDEYRALMAIQAAVQQAIVSRGWSFEISYNPNSPDPNYPYDVTVDGGGWGISKDNVVEALLSAYLDNLEVRG